MVLVLLKSLQESKYFIGQNVLLEFKNSRLKVLAGENSWLLLKSVTFPQFLPQQGILLFLVYTAFNTCES